MKDRPTEPIRGTLRRALRSTIATLVGFHALFALACAHDTDAARSTEVSTQDVHRFVDVIRRGESNWDCGALRPYFDSASAGLRAYDRKFHVGVKELCGALKTNSARYEHIAPMLPALDTAAREVSRVFARFRALDTDARLPDTYFVVGNGISAGTTTRGPSPRILVGVELLHSANGLTWTLSHELAHTQQDYPFLGSLTDGPTFLRATVLRQAVVEGSADLVAEVLTGLPKRNAYAESHEAEIWRAFQHDMDSRDYRRWFYNGRDSSARGAWPPDVGYWVGYRIARSFYARRSDKAGALHDILTIRDFHDFLARSGYDGGESR